MTERTKKRKKNEDSTGSESEHPAQNDEIKAVKRQITQVYTKGTVNIADEESLIQHAESNNILCFLRYSAD